MPSNLFLPSWVEFNRQHQGLEPIHLTFSKEAGQLPSVETIFYLNKAGRIRFPRINPYLPVQFHPTPTQQPARLSRQWVSVAGLMAAYMTKRGMSSAIVLPPEILDVRPWQWAGLRATARYTLYLDFPYNEEHVDRSVRKDINKALKRGFRCEQTSDIKGAHECVRASEERQGFSFTLSLKDMELAQKLTGEDSRLYVCYAPDGEPAAALAVLHQHGERVVPWVTGNKTTYLNDGATQLLWKVALEDLQSSGATGFDLAGANTPTVTYAKENWGAQLKPMYKIESPNLKNFFLQGRDTMRFYRNRRGTA